MNEKSIVSKPHSNLISEICPSILTVPTDSAPMTECISDKLSVEFNVSEIDISVTARVLILKKSPSPVELPKVLQELCSRNIDKSSDKFILTIDKSMLFLLVGRTLMLFQPPKKG